MKKKLLSALKFALFLAIGGFLLWLVLRGQDIDEIRSAIKEANFWWIGLSVLLGVISHLSRSIRWNLLILPLGYSPKLHNTFMAVMIGYFANLAFPRLGEVSKCVILKRYEEVPVNKLLGTMIVERASDLIALLFFLALTLILEFGLLSQFFMDNIVAGFQEKISSSSNTLLIGAGILVLAVIGGIIAWRLFRRSKLAYRLKDLVAGFVEGLKSIGKMKNKWYFIFHSVLIWVLYYLMTYTALFAFTDLAHLGSIAALAVFVFGSLGMVAPVQGGIGAFHFMTIATLALYSIDESTSRAFAFLIHGAQTFMIIILGFFSLILLPIVNRKKIHATADLAVDPAQGS